MEVANDVKTESFMNLAPLKKRRGRPPKYLNVWRQQYISGIMDSQQTPPPPPPPAPSTLAADSDLGDNGHLRKAENQVGAPEPDTSDMDITGKLDANDGPPDIRPVSPPRDRETSPLTPDGRESPGGIPTLVAKECLPTQEGKDLNSAPGQNIFIKEALKFVKERKIIDGLISMVNDDQKNIPHSGSDEENATAVKTDFECSQTTDSARPPENHENTNSLNQATERTVMQAAHAHLTEQIQSQQFAEQENKHTSAHAVKRRPGRPPGSTKRFKVPFGTECRGKETSPEEFSLRKFFEAGGRDYNDYLEWLKKRGSHPQHVNCLHPNGGQYMPIPMNTVRSLPPSTAMPGLPPLQAGMPQMYAPRSPAVAITPPAMYRSSNNVQGIRGPFSPPVIRSASDVISYPNLNSFVPTPVATFIPTTPLDLSAKKRMIECEHEREIHRVHDSLGHRLFSELPGLSPVAHTISENTEQFSLKGERLMTPSPTFSRRNDEKVESSTSGDIIMWDVEQVVKFVASVPGCQDYTEVFREHRIDGATLPHLSEDHLLNFVKMKLGPAIRLRLAVSRLQNEAQ